MPLLLTASLKLEWGKKIHNIDFVSKVNKEIPNKRLSGTITNMLKRRQVKDTNVTLDDPFMHKVKIKFQHVWSEHEEWGSRTAI